MDAFAGLDGLGGSTSNKKLSLADQLKAEEANKRKAAQAWDSLDLLDPAFQSKSSGTPSLAPSVAQSPALSSSGSSPAPASSANNKQAVGTTQIEDDDVFGLFASAPPPQPKPRADPQPKPEPRNEPQPQPKSNGRTRVETNRPASSRRETPPVQSSASSSSSQRSRNQAAVSDRSLAYLIDMGFEPEDASRALTAMDGQVRGAVNYLMAEAQGLPLPKPKQSASQQLANLGNADLSEFSAAASQFGSSMFSKASSLWSKGRKEIEKAYNQYNGQPQGSSGQPAWMRDKAKYDARKSRLEREGSPASSVASSEQDLPSRSQSDPPRSVGEDPPMPQRPSRAEMFRRKQMERGTASRGSSGASTPGGTPVEPQIPEQKPVQRSPAPEPAEPAVDLLNLSGQASQPQLTTSQTDIYSVSRELGSESFKKGNYESAVEHYTAALGAVPEGNVLRALLLSNRSAALMKAGNARAAFDDTNAGLQMLPNKGAGLDAEGKPMTDIWVKLVTRNAQAAEQMEKYEAALTSWQLLLDNGYATPAALDAKRRCQKALNPDTVAAAEAQAKPRPKRRGWGTTGAGPTSASGKAALEKVRNEHKQLHENERQRDLLRDRVSGRVDAWKAGNETNLRALLATLHTVLWEGSGWTPVPATELVVPKKVRIVYMKAVARTHPDKVSADVPMEVRMISESVFITIQKAWEVFRVENNI